jgi:hypothetical protein
MMRPVWTYAVAQGLAGKTIAAHSADIKRNAGYAMRVAAITIPERWRAAIKTVHISRRTGELAAAPLNHSHQHR